jgi:hypothetical protein
MKPHPIIRKTIKWGGAAVTVVLVVVWIGSGWGRFGTPPGARYRVDIWHGRLSFAHSDGNGMVVTYTWRTQIGRWLVIWSPDAQLGSSRWLVCVPLWPLFLCSSSLSAVLGLQDARARLRAREKLNLCPKCGYDRAGIAADAKCPECGCGRASGRPASNEPRTK